MAAGCDGNSGYSFAVRVVNRVHETPSLWCERSDLPVVPACAHTQGNAYSQRVTRLPLRCAALF
jgi:hypothetical protein